MFDLRLEGVGWGLGYARRPSPSPLLSLAYQPPPPLPKKSKMVAKHSAKKRRKSERSLDKNTPALHAKFLDDDKRKLEDENEHDEDKIN